MIILRNVVSVSLIILSLSLSLGSMGQNAEALSSDLASQVLKMEHWSKDEIIAQLSNDKYRETEINLYKSLERNLIKISESLLIKTPQELIAYFFAYEIIYFYIIENSMSKQDWSEDREAAINEAVYSAANAVRKAVFNVSIPIEERGRMEYQLARLYSLAFISQLRFQEDHFIKIYKKVLCTLTNDSQFALSVDEVMCNIGQSIWGKVLLNNISEEVQILKRVMETIRKAIDSNG